MDGMDRDGPVHRCDGRIRPRDERGRRCHVREGHHADPTGHQRSDTAGGSLRGRARAGCVVCTDPHRGLTALGGRSLAHPRPPGTSLVWLVVSRRWARLSPGESVDALPDCVHLLRWRRAVCSTPGARTEPSMTNPSTLRDPELAAQKPLPTARPAPKKPKARPMSRGERIFRVVNVIVLCGFALICLIPFVHVIGSSFATPGEIATTNFLLIPKEFTLSAYRYVLSTPTIFRAMGVSVIVTVGGTLLSLVVTALMAYALAKPYLAGRRVVNFLVIFTMLFSGGMIPTFIVVSKLGLIDSLWALVLPVTVNAFNFVIMRNFFQGIPDSLEEAARIDGCSELGVFLRIVLPLSVASIATIGLFYAVTYWNTYMHAILYINDSSK